MTSPSSHFEPHLTSRPGKWGGIPLVPDMGVDEVLLLQYFLLRIIFAFCTHPCLVTVLAALPDAQTNHQLLFGCIPL